MLWYKSRNNDHAELSLLLQKAEADVMIKGACTELLSLKNPPFFLTIHDSIVCEKSRGQEVQKVLLDVFKVQLNLSPKAAIKSLIED